MGLPTRLGLFHTSTGRGDLAPTNTQFERQSSLGFSRMLVSLLQEYQRHDVLEYHWVAGRIPRKVVVAQWQPSTANLNRNTMIGGVGI